MRHLTTRVIALAIVIVAITSIPSRATASPRPATTGAVPLKAVVSSGYESTCALVAGGRVECWGYGQDGELGNAKMLDSATPVLVKGIAGAKQVATGWDHACALLGNGAVKCWGYGYNGQLGNGLTKDESTPVAVKGVLHARSIAAGGYESCALFSNGTANRC